MPSFGQLKQAEKGLIWGLIHNTGEALDALSELDSEDLDELAAGRSSKWRGACTTSRWTSYRRRFCSV